MAFHFSTITPNLDKMQYGPHNLPASPTASIWYGWKILLFDAKFSKFYGQLKVVLHVDSK